MDEPKLLNHLPDNGEPAVEVKMIVGGGYTVVTRYILLSDLLGAETDDDTRAT